MSEQERPGSVKPPLAWPNTGVIDVNYNGELQTAWACRFGTLTEILKAGVARFGDKEMWHFPDFDIRWSFNDFNAAVNNVAYGLQEDCGIRKGDRVALMANNVPEAYVCYLALSQIGAISVIINARLAPEEAARQLQDAGSIAVVIEAALWDGMQPVVESLPGLKAVFVSGRTPLGRAKAFSELMDRPAPREIRVDVSERDICSLIYTSGTTGRPKGVITTHRALVNNAMNGLSCAEGIYHARPEDWRQLIVTPFFHVTTLHTLINFTLLGATAVVMSTFKPKEALDLVIDEEINFMVIVTAMYWILKLQPRYPELVKANRLKYILQGGSPMPPEMFRELFKEFPDARVGNGYGFTEGASLGWLMFMAGDWETLIQKAGSVGGTLGNSLLRIVDEKFKDVPRGQTGEILAASPGISPGYWNLPGETAQSYVVDADGRRWFKTGDLGYTDADGYTFLVDRAKDMICRGGENVYCVELENLLSQNAKVLEVGVVGVPDPVLGEKIKAVIFPIPGETPTEEEIRAFCRGRIAEYKLPDYIVFTNQMLPKNPGGKLMKKELKNL
ncbi:MAG TPA: class I adenylate-forming enzyme family protein [Syntrophales bacterium]|nr:class I adenylate-forming enzyme family protein [Syntrophales bacterium]HQN26811.1 class I adenylate-forming enzyme family protein [Syntrophales bacterium]